MRFNGSTAPINFLDVAQAFYKIWLESLIYKLNKMLSKQHVEIQTSHISNSIFRVKQDVQYFERKELKAGVHQGNVMGLIRYLLYTRDFPALEDTVVATSGNETAFLARDQDQESRIVKLHGASNSVVNWTRQKRKLNSLKLNQSK